MKKIYFTSAIFILCLGLNAQIIIPDANFKAKLLEANTTNSIAKDINNNNIKIDINNNNEIEQSEALLVYRLFYFNVPFRLNQTNPETNSVASNYNIADATGIEFFINLRKLDFSFNQLTSLNVTTLTQLDYLNCRNNSISNLNISGLNNLNFLDISSNNLPNLNISSLTSLTNYQCANNGITNLILYPNIQILNCANNQLTQINLNVLPNLKGLDVSYNQLTNLILPSSNFTSLLNISGNLYTSVDLTPIHTTYSTQFICENSNIIQLDFSNVPRYYNYRIYNNPNLEWINFKNGYNDYCILIPFNPSECIYSISNNAQLQFVCVDDDDEIDVFLGLLNGQNINVNSYCSNSPGGANNTINGSVSYDCGGINQTLPNLKIGITDGINSGTTFTNTLGNYMFHTGVGVHTITPIIQNPAFFSVTPSSIPISFTTTGNNQTANFCVSPIGVHPDLEIVLVPIALARPGFDATYKLTLKNNGNQIQSGTLTYNFNDTVLDFISAIPTTTTNSLNTLTWSFMNLTPFETKVYSITLNVNSPQETPAVIIGDVLTFTTFISTSQTDETPNNNTFNLNQTVVGSFDPNDKTCIEGNQIAIADAGKPLHYVVRFQNTGTAAAENVVIKDVLNFKLDWNSVQIIASSHPFRSTLIGNKLEFFYENINLPASIVNEPASHGYISFSVKPKSNVVINDIITNTANIYFDYNFPIVTNTTSTTVVALNNLVFELEDYFTLYPNPVKNELIVNVKNNIEINLISIYNTLGQLVKTNPSSNVNTILIDVSELNSGTYFIAIETDKGKLTKKFIKL